jgi:hypothetical protein
VGALNAGAGALVFARVAAIGESWVLERLGENPLRARERALTAQVLGGRTFGVFETPQARRAVFARFA